MTQLVPPFARERHLPPCTPLLPMPRRAAQFFAKLMMVACAFAGVAFGQKDGIASFSAADPHDFDTVNLLTLIPSFNFPVISKPGAMPYSASIEVPQSCHIASDGAGDTYWTCGESSGNNSISPFAMIASNSMIGLTVGYTPLQQQTCTKFTITSLTGADGISRYYLPYTTLWYGNANNPGACGSTSATLTTNDNSGYTATISTASGFAVITALSYGESPCLTAD